MPLTITEPIVADTARLPICKAAQVLGIDRRTLTKLIDEGLVRVGHRRISRQNQRAFVAGSEIKRYWRSRI